MDALIAAISDPQAWIALLTLLMLEIVLGIDNVVFISILSSKLPTHQQARARKTGLGLALISRIGLLLSITWIMRLTKPLFALYGHEVSGKDIILILGGLFLIAKATHEIHSKLEGDEPAEGAAANRKAYSFAAIIVQILLIDIVFSLDSVITAVGMAQQLWVMVTAVVLATCIMLAFAGMISAFVEKHPTIKMLALSFLVLIGVNLIADGFGHHIPKGYTYFAMAFSILVEMLNLKLRKRHTPPLHLRGPSSASPDPATPQ